MMVEEGAEFICCMEVLPRLGSMQISLLSHCHQLTLSQESVYAGSSGPHLQKHDHISTKCSFGGSKAALTSPLRIKLASGILSFKLKIMPPTSQPDVLVPPSDVLSNWIDEPSMLTLTCSFCSCKLTKRDFLFTRVLPLPSETWDEFGGGVFCHYRDHTDHPGDCGGSSGDSGDPMAAPSAVRIVPRDGDCLFSASSLLVAGSSLDERHTDQNSGKVRCRRCLRILGDQMTSNEKVILTLQRSCVHVKLKKDEVLEPSLALSNLEHHFANLLYSFSQTKMSFRYLVTDPDGHSHLLVWMLNVCCRMTCNANPEIFSKFSGCGKTQDGNSSKVLKILFKDTPGEMRSASAAMETAELKLTTTQECLQLRLLLTENHMSLPPAQRTASGYKVIPQLRQKNHLSLC